jgi:hypothetical protein
VADTTSELATADAAEDESTPSDEEGPAGEPLPVEESGTSSIERLEAGLQDSLDLSSWRMPTVRDYAWYIAVYGVAIVGSAYIIVRYRALWAYTIWGSYLAVLIVLAFLLVRSLGYRRSMLSKRFEASTFDLQTAVEAALKEVGIAIASAEAGGGEFLHPLITTYRLDKRDFIVRLEGRAHHERKTVSVGRLDDPRKLFEGQRFSAALDCELDRICKERVPRALFK